MGEHNPGWNHLIIIMVIKTNETYLTPTGVRSPLSVALAAFDLALAYQYISIGGQVR